MNINWICYIENIFTVQDFWATCACLEKHSFPSNFSLYWIYFLPFKIFEQLCSYPEEQFALKFFTVFNIFFTFRIFEQLAPALDSPYWIYIFLQWRAVRCVTGEALSLSKPNLRVYELNRVALLQPLRRCCVDCVINHERDVREEQKYMYVARTSNNTVISSGDLYCCLLPRCEALRTFRSGFPIATA